MRQPLAEFLFKCPEALNQLFIHGAEVASNRLFTLSCSAATELMQPSTNAKRLHSLVTKDLCMMPITGH